MMYLSILYRLSCWKVYFLSKTLNFRGKTKNIVEKWKCKKNPPCWMTSLAPSRPFAYVSHNNNNNNNNNETSAESTGWLFSSLFPGRIGIWKCWFLRGEENRSTRRKTLGVHMTPSPGIEPGPHWWEAAWEANAQPLRHPCSHNINISL